MELQVSVGACLSYTVQELSNDKASAELELRARMGTLRYLLTVKAREASKAAVSGGPALEGAAEEQKDAQQQQQAQPSTGDGSGSAAAASQQQLPGGGSGPAAAAVASKEKEEEDQEEICTICHDRLGHEQARLASEALHFQNVL